MSISVSEARRRFFPLLEQVNNDHLPILITSQRGNAVLIAQSDYEAIEDKAAGDRASAWTNERPDTAGDASTS